MRRRNPACRSLRRNAGPAPWPSAAVIAILRRTLVRRRGLPPEASAEAIRYLRADDAWFGGVDMTRATDAQVMARLTAWLEGVGSDGSEPGRRVTA